MKKDILDNNEYKLYNETSAERLSLPLSRGYRVGKFPGQSIQGHSIPRSACPQLDNTLLAEYYASISANLADVRPQEQDSTPRSQADNVILPQGINDSPESEDGRGPYEQRRAPKQQNTPDFKGPTVEHRQLDIDQDSEQDADTDSELP
jgi:hypothetical protein